jgi:predicted HicB family RNase H-like nuclease
MHCYLCRESYDDRITIPIDLPDDVMFALMKQAHEQDITFNQHVEQVLRSEIEKLAIQHGITN